MRRTARPVPSYVGSSVSPMWMKHTCGNASIFRPNASLARMSHSLSPDPVVRSFPFLPAAASTVTSRQRLRRHHLWSAALVSAMLSAPTASRAADAVVDGWTPGGAFVQVARGSSHADAATVGLMWRLAPAWRLGPGSLSLYLEASVGRWFPGHEGSGEHPVTQFGLTPVVRLRADGPWFGELGIGANGIAPRYQDGHRRFSTEFNFGSHLAVGRSFGAAREHEVALRIEHFSNGGISEPNPGINFVQLRYARWF